MTGDWDSLAAEWDRRSVRFERSVQGLTLEMIERARLFAGESVLELACGPGGMLGLLADLVAPGGSVIAGDSSAGMVDMARRRVEREGLRGVAVEQLDLDWLDVESASVGAVLCRFGYMFATDPAAALGEARRVLRPGGRFVTAVWDLPERNPYGTLPLAALSEVGLGEPAQAGQPGMFRLAEEGLTAGLLLGAGFTEVEVTPVAVSFVFDDDDDLLDWVTSLSGRVVEGLGIGAEGSLELFAAELRRLCAPHRRADGLIILAGTALVASARA